MTLRCCGNGPLATPDGAADRSAHLERRLANIEAALERLERRVWLGVYGAASLILADIAFGLLSLTVS